MLLGTRLLTDRQQNRDSCEMDLTHFDQLCYRMNEIVGKKERTHASIWTC